jgi:gamma-glutamyltranspeptidase/glutathione hydrolase
MMEQLDWGSLAAADPLREHYLAEAWRRAYADRYLLGDPATSRVDAASLLADDWIARRSTEIDAERATPSQEVGHWPGGETEIPGDTTHLSVADGAGNVVALTTTLNGWFGCALLVEGAGFFLNNEMDDFAAAIDQPNLFDLVQGEANEVRPGARMLSSMTPTIAWRGDEVIALGSPGGGKIPTATARVLLHLIVDELPLRQAVVHPRTHHQWQPDELRIEPDALSDELRAALQRRGHRLREVPSMGEVHGVRIFADGTREAYADARGPGAAGVVDRMSE